MNKLQEIQSKIASLQEQILTAHPRMPMLLKEIHDHLRRDPEIVTLLPEDEIAIVVSGLKKQTNTEIATTIAKNKSPKASLKNISVNDL